MSKILRRAQAAQMPIVAAFTLFSSASFVAKNEQHSNSNASASWHKKDRKVLSGWMSSMIVLVLLFLSQVDAFAQPTVLGSQVANGSYVTYDLNAIGGFKQVRVQATSSGAISTRNWEFATGTAGAPNYTTNWRPYTGGNTLSANTFIPTSFANGAKYNTGSGGASGLLPAITTGNYYTFNVSNNAAADNVMQLLETTFNPVTISTVSFTTPANTNNSSKVTITTSAAPAVGENVFVRFTTDNYVTSNLTQVAFNGTTGTAYIPCRGSAGTVSFYVYSSNKTAAAINADVTGNGQAAHDMATLNLNNNAGANYNYTQGTGSATSFSGDYQISTPGCYPTLASFITALNAGTIAGPVNCFVSAGYTETAPAGGYVINATGTVANPITFVKFGAGTNPTLTAGVGTTTTTDAIIKIIGGDYITIDGFSLLESATNTTATTQVEWGIALLHASVTNGCQNNTIQNNTITLNKTNLNTFGIYSNNNHSATVIGTTESVTNSTTGPASGNKVYANTINNVNMGIAFIGTSTAANQDIGNDIGGSTSGTGNTISNWGGAAATSSYVSNSGTSYCIYLNHQVGENVSYNTITSANISGTSVALRGIFKDYSTGATLVGTTSITNNTITITDNFTSGTLECIRTQGTVASTSILLDTANTILNTTMGGASSSTTIVGIVNSSAWGTLKMNGNIIRGASSTATTGGFTGVSNTGAVVTTIEMNRNQIGNASGGAITFSAATSGALLGVNNTGGASTCNATIQGNDFRGISYSALATSTNTYITQTAAVASANINGNTFTNLSLNTSGAIVFINHGYSIPATGQLIINNNSIATAFTRLAAGSITITTSNSTSGNGSINNYTNNNFSNIIVPDNASSTIIGFNNTDGGTGSTKTITGNTFNNWNGGTTGTTGTSSTINCMNFTYWNGASSLSNNTITNITGRSSITAVTLGAASNAASAIVVSGNTINNLISIGTGGAVTGITCSNTSTSINISSNTINTLSSTGAFAVVGIGVTGATTTNVFKNKIYDLSGSNGSSAVNGVLVSAGSTVNVHNNLIGDLRTTAANASNPLIGLSITGGTTVNAYYNTVYLNGSSTGALFGSSALSVSTTPTFTARNNIFVNTSSVAGAGLAVAYRRSGTSLTSYGATSNNNMFFTNSSYFTDGTNTDATFAAYKTRVSPRDAASVSENPPFLSTTGSSSDFLHINPAIGTQVESGAAPIATYTEDFDGNARNATTPDIGADEGAFTGVDLTPPTITYTPLGNGPVGVNQTLTATITDVSGVPTSGTGLPVLYWKLNSGTYNPVTATSIGSNQYTFTFGGASTMAGDIISYYIVAQDNVSPTPNVGAFPAAGAAGFTANPPAAATPPTTPSTFTAVANISGTKTVCPTGCDYASLTNAAGAFASINAAVVTGNVNLEITGDLTTETGANALNAFASGFTLKMYPTGAARTISGALASAALIKLNGADRVNIDGSIGGTGTDRSLTITNTSTTSPTAIALISLGTAAGATNDTIKNCLINTGSNAATSYAISVGGATPGTAGDDNDNTIIQNNLITKAYIGVYAAANATGTNNNLLITQNTIGSSTVGNEIQFTGIILLQSTTGSTVNSNTITNILTSAAVDPIGINLSTGVANTAVSRNSISGVNTTNTSGYGGRGIQINTGSASSNITVSNNAISDIKGSGWNAITSDAIMGIAIGNVAASGGINLFYNSVNLGSGTFAGNSSGTVSAALAIAAGCTNLDIRNNVLVTNLVNSGASTAKSYAIYSAAANTAFTIINYNDYFVSGSQGVLGFLGSDRTNLAGIIAGFGQNANSVSGNPQFVSATDLHINPVPPTLVESGGTPIAGVTVDYDGDTRNATTPDIGADEGNFTAFSTNDMAATAFIDPTNGGTKIVNVGFTPQASFTNAGLATQTTVPVKYRILGPSPATTEVYNETITIASIASGVTTTVTFPSVNLSTAGVYTIEATAALVGDQAPSNDTITGTLNVAGPLCGNYNVGSAETAPFNTLTNALTRLALVGVSCPVKFILTDASYAGSETFPLTIGAFPGSSSVNTFTIEAGVTSSISGSNATAIFNLNGGKNITIDGRVNGTGSTPALTITNTNTTAPAILFINEASNNHVKYANLKSDNTTTSSGGVVLFSTTTGANGNDNDTLSYCNIGPNLGTPTNGIASVGSTTTSATNNSGNLVTNCNIFDFFSATSDCNGILLAAGNDSWSMINNNFYETASRTFTSSGSALAAIQVNNSSGNNFILSGNSIGGSTTAAGGSPLTLLGNGVLRGIRLTVGTTTPSSIQGNTIQNIAVTSASGSSVQSAISLLTGSVNVGNVTGNIIGSSSVDASSSPSIDLSISGSSAVFSGILAGTGTPGALNIANNTIGGIRLVNTGPPATGTILRGLAVQGSPTSLSISNNTIGSNSSSNSITSSTNAALQGIFLSTTLAGTTVSNNTVSNLATTNTGTSSQLIGLLLQGSSGGSFTTTGNTVKNLNSTSTSTSTSSSASIIGISHTASTTAGQTVAQNTVYNLTNSNTTLAVAVTGIHYAGPTTGTNLVARNLVYDLNLVSTSATAELRGISFTSGLANVQNNMVRIGSTVSTGNTIYGLYEVGSTTGSAINFNSVYIGGSSVGTQTGNSFAFRSDQTINTRTFQNNIFINGRSNATTGGKHYAVRVAGSSANPGGLTLNYNDYQATGTGGVFGFFNSADVANLTAWRTAVGQDANSLAIDPQFIDPTGTTPDLHIHPTNPTPIEGAGFPIVGVTDDYDGQTRSGLSPTDMGADAGDFVAADFSAPSISYTALPTTCSGGDRALNGVTITDASGVPTTGALQPRVYYKKGLAGTWFSSQGTLASGSAANGSWDFTIVAADMGGVTGGDAIYYYVIAQDIAGTPNIAANPGAGLVATDVNTVTTPPTTPNNYNVGITLSGTYSVGTGQAPTGFNTLTAAVAAYNGGCPIAGAVTFSLADASYASETYPIVINTNAGASAANTLTIKPTQSATTFTGSSASAMIVINGADYVTLDGSTSATNNTVCPPSAASRNLTLTNTNTSTTSAVVWLQTASGDGATNNKVINCNLVGNSNTTTLFGVGSGSSTIGLTSVGTGNNNNSFINNNISKTQVGIFSQGASAANKNTGTVINQNLINTVSPNNVAYNGIRVGFEDGITISGNNIANLKAPASTDGIAIALGSGAVLASSFTGNEVINATVTQNVIDTIRGASTYSAVGIYLPTTTNTGTTLIANNMISRVNANGTSGDLAAGIFLGAVVGAVNVYHNTVTMTGTLTGADHPTFAFASASSVPTIDLRNNIFTSTGSTGANLNRAVGFAYSTYTNLTSDNNDLFVSGTSSAVAQTVTLTTSGTSYTTLANWTTASTKDANSVSAAPVFVSSTDLHLVPTNASNVTNLNAKAAVVSVTTDIDCATMDVSTPDIGADEFDGCVPSTAAVLSGNASICVGNSTNLQVAITGGTPPFTVVYNDGVGDITVNNYTSGSNISVSPTATTTYTLVSVTSTVGGCIGTGNSGTALVTVNTPSTAAVLSGDATICAGGTTNLSVAITGGTSPFTVVYSDGTNNFTVNSYTSGSAIPVSPGATTTYTLVSVTSTGGCAGTGNSGSALVTVSPNANAGTVSGTSPLCIGATTTYSSDGDTGGTWSSSNTAVATVNPTSGLVTAVSPGSCDIIYTVSTGCNSPVSAQQAVTVSPNANAGTVNGTSPLCIGATATYSSNGDAGGTWSSSNNAVATVNATSGLVTAVSAGNCDIIYTVSAGCNAPVSAQQAVTVSPNANAGTVSGTSPLCIGATATYSSNGDAGGTWSSSNAAIATVNATSGLVTAVSAGNCDIIYTVSAGCNAPVSAQQSVNISPNANAGTVSGTSPLCIGATTTYSSNGDAGGTWSSSNAAIATVNATSGLVTAVSAGNCDIIYTVSAGCNAPVSAQQAVTVSPNANAGTVSGTSPLCIGATATYTSNGDAGGTWTSSNTAVATVNATSGVVTAVSAGNCDIIYTVSAGCNAPVSAQQALTVSPNANAGTVNGTSPLCIGATATYSSNGDAGGTWSSSNTAVATVNATSGLVTAVSAGNCDIIYTVSAGCNAPVSAQQAVTVSPNANAGTVSGTSPLCIGATATYTSNGDAGGNWSSSNTAVATVNATSGVVTAVSAGNCDIVYTVSTGCNAPVSAQKAVTISPNANAGTVNGTSPLCIGATATYSSNGDAGGTWSSSNTAIATVNATSGVVTAVSAGNCDIIYTVSAGCNAPVSAQQALTVSPNANAGTVNGTSPLCIGATATYSSNGDAGGTWSSSNAAIATVNATSGLVTAVSAGNCDIIYTVSAGCNAPVSAQQAVTVSPNANAGTVTGTSPLCIGATATYSSNGDAGGTWSSSNTAVATVNATSGLVTAVSAGNCNIIYTVSTGCNAPVSAQQAVTVSPNANAGTVSGTSPLCIGATATYTSNGDASGTWSSSNTAVATVNATSGVVTAVSAGTCNIIYTVTTGCNAPVSAQQAVTVSPNANAGTVSGTSPLCIGATTTYTSNGDAGGTWSSSNNAFATVNPTSGLVTAVAAGTCNIIYTVTAGCAAPVSSSSSVTINPDANAGTVSGASPLCIGATTTYTSDGDAGGTWTSSNTAFATVNASTGLVTAVAAGTCNIIYTVSAGCNAPVSAQKSVTVSPNANAGTVSGASPLCIGATTTYTSNGDAGGTWSSSNTAFATVNASTGVVTAVAAGTCNIIYTVTAGCAAPVSSEKSVTISPNANAGTVSGTSPLCIGATATYTSDGDAGGTWSSSNTAFATVNASTGLVTAVAAGTCNIIYTVTAGCAAPVSSQQSITISPNANAGTVAGSSPLCIGATTTYTSNGDAGGTWSSSNTSFVTVNASTGLVTAIAAGTCNIIYTVSDGCNTPVSAQKSVTVSPNANAGTVSGTSPLCIGATVTYTSNGDGGGTWSSSNTAFATVNASTGQVTAVAAGTCDIIYTVTAGCAAPVSSQKSVTVSPNANAGTVFGTSPLCIGATATYTSNGDAGGTWSSSNTAFATVNATSGLVTAVAAGTCNIIYTVTSGCAAPVSSSKSITISPDANAGVLSGASPICSGGSTLYTSNGDAGGTWSSSNAAIATVDAAGLVTAQSIGTCNIIYTVSTGCNNPTTSTKSITVTPSANAGTISGTSPLCISQVSTFTSDGDAGGTWSSSNAAVASVNASTGQVTGQAPGSCTIVYTVTTCGSPVSTSIAVTVNPNASAGVISGNSPLCIGATDTYSSNGDAGGTWSSSNTAFATVNASSGLVTAVGAGTCNIIYTVTAGCNAPVSATKSITISPNANAGTITGTAPLCIGATATYTSNGDTGGTWTSSNVAFATVNSTTGVVTAVATGTCNIIYTVSTGCNAPVSSQKSVTVDPNANAGTVSGTSPLCIGATATYTSNGDAGGTWSSSNTAFATVNPTTGLVTAVAAGTCNIIYTVTAGCAAPVSASQSVTVNPNANAGTVSGTSPLCIGATTTYTSNGDTGGTWSSSNTAFATVNSSTGLVTAVAAGTCDIIYTVTAGCNAPVSAQKSVTVSPIANAGSVSGTSPLCIGSTTTYTSDGDAGGTWSSSNTAFATVNPSTGLVTAVAAGTCNIIYTVTAGCAAPVSAQKSVTISPNANAGTVSGTSPLCIGGTTTYTSNGDAGGTWSSSNTAFATVNATSGLVTAVASGTCNIIYTVTAGCNAPVSATKSITISPNANAGTITGTSPLCIGATTTYTSNGDAGGTWSSSNTAFATVNATSGLVTAVAPGTCNIIYTVSAGCNAPVSSQKSVTVSPNANAGTVSGTSPLCIGGTTTYTSNGDAGGTWSSSNTAFATVNASTGLVTAVAAGTCNIIYTVTAGCAAPVSSSKSVTVNPNANAGTVSGTSPLCIGATTTYTSNGDAGGSWSSSNTAFATVNASTGLVTAVAAGTCNIIYTVSAGCNAPVSSQKSVTVSPNANAGTVSGASPLCIGATTTYTSNGEAGGTWSSSNTAFATVNPSTGAVTAVAAGTCNIIYTVTTGCAAPVSSQKSVTISPNANAGTVSGTSPLCIGATATYTSNGDAGGTWTSSNTAFATVNASSGLVTAVAAGTCNIIYTVTAGCNGPVSSTKSITISPNASAGSISGTSPLCTGTTSTFTSNGNTGGTWSSSNTAFATVNPSTGFVTAVAAGSCNIIYTVSAGCNAPVTTQFALTVVTPATSDAGPNKTTCGTTPVALAAVGTGSWSGGSGSFSNANSSTSTYTPTVAEVGSVVTLTWTVTSPSPCSNAVDQMDVTVQNNGEINVRGNLISIVDGDLTPDLTDHTDFGSVSLGGSFARTYTIQNLGTATLVVDSIKSDYGLFVVGALSPSGPIAPADSASFTVTFNASLGGAQSAIITVYTKDCDEAVYDYKVQANNTCTPPSFTTCPGAIAVSTGNSNCVATVNYNAVTSGSPTPTLTYAFSGQTTGSGNGTGSGSNFNKGVTQVTITAANGCGNNATCTFTVTVNDTVKPTALCRNLSLNLGSNGTVQTNAVAVNNGSFDNCGGTVGINSLALSKTNFTCADFGPNTVTLTATDQSNNTGTCSAVITIGYNQPPVAKCRNAIVALSSAGNGSISPAGINNGSTDLCSSNGLNLSLSKTTFNCSNVGSNVVTLTVTNVAGLSSSCTATVTVKDLTKPVARCQSITIPLINGQSVTVLPSQINNGSTDACTTPPLLSLTPNTFVCANNGPNTVTLTATDGSGNAGTCTATVTINCTPNGNIKSNGTTAVANLVELWDVFPNPASDHVMVRLHQASTAERMVTILDYSGKVVFNQVLGAETNQLSIDLKEHRLSAGVYMVSIKFATSIQTKQLVIFRD